MNKNRPLLSCPWSSAPLEAPSSRLRYYLTWRAQKSGGRQVARRSFRDKNRAEIALSAEIGSGSDAASLFSFVHTLSLLFARATAHALTLNRRHPFVFSRPGPCFHVFVSVFSSFFMAGVFFFREEAARF